MYINTKNQTTRGESSVRNRFYSIGCDKTVVDRLKLFGRFILAADLERIFIIDQ